VDAPRKQRRAAPQEKATPDTVAAPPQDPLADVQPSAMPAAELQFQEPVRTVVSGDQVITLRRLTPEEKAALAASDYGATTPAGPPTGAVAYPYYTTRGPRDFLAKKPPSIGP
jgi:hypothetical protein